MKSGIEHIVSAVPVLRSQYENEEHHDLVHGNSFPASPVERQLFYRDDLHKWAQYRNGSWRYFASENYVDTEVAAAVAAHNAAVLSTTVHNNPNYCLAYGNEVIAGLPTAGSFPAYPKGTKTPTLTALADPLSKIDVSDWYGASGAYIQSDADSDATHIQDEDAAFPASICNTVVKWASNAAGDANTGIGVITTVAATTLTIVKCSGANFAGSYYYWIKHSEIVVPVTGIYSIDCSILFYPAEADKSFEAQICYYAGTSAPVAYSIFTEVAPIAASNKAAGCTKLSLTADWHLWVGAYFAGTGGTPTLYGHSAHTWLRIFLLKQTA